MMRKTAGTLEEQRNQIKRTYKHGARSRRVVVNFETLTEFEKGMKIEAACFLKAADFSHTYIGEALGVSRGVVKGWFEDNPEMREKVAKIQKDYIDGAVKLLKTYAIELVEMLVEIARSDVDPATRIKAITEALDRMGMSKVNKSESVVSGTQKSEVELVDKSGMIEKLKDAPPEVQAQVAEHMEQVLALTAEHTGLDVTHGN